MKKNFLIMFSVLLAVLLIVPVIAIDKEREERLEFGYVVDVLRISTEPDTLTPGNPGKLKITLKNKAKFDVFDLRLEVDLPSQIALLKDTSRRRISRMYSGEIIQISYEIIALPTASEGVYEANYNLTYLNHVGTERSETDSFSAVVKGDIDIYAQVEETTLYKGNNIGEVTIKFINDEVADIKFLTAKLEESEDYEIISNKREYIGDLDSDDFESVDFKIKILNEKEKIPLKLNLDFKDSLNNDMSYDTEIILEIREPSELGIKSNNTYVVVIVVIVVIIVAYFMYRRYKKGRRKKEKY
ncbi:hypothetical protein GF386_03435 [Candidatus Pacearchaeota archaeon]|nr:hypothetical protein [Candidatus Pacearchaeota archaeon]MBD3283194.1 hypothetical protein [Candidatus Pacearchaeota archaeon]